MPDIQMRFNKDMLVLSTPLDYQLASQGFDPSDREYVVLCEPELIEEAFKLEKSIDVPCFVTPTEGITEARLAYARFEGRAEEMARIAYETSAQFSPQHLIAAIGPTGLPLDPTSAVSLKQSKKQYHDAVLALIEYPFDALYFTGFKSLDDAQCALMGARAVYDGPVLISLVPNEEGMFSGGRTLSEGVALCDEYGADVIGVVSDAPARVLVGFAKEMASVTDKPLLVDVSVRRKDRRQFEPTNENPYPTADAMVELVVRLRAQGVNSFEHRVPPPRLYGCIARNGWRQRCCGAAVASLRLRYCYRKRKAWHEKKAPTMVCSRSLSTDSLMVAKII